jgi:hypothetical protein
MNAEVSRVYALVDGLRKARETAKDNPYDVEAQQRVTHFVNTLRQHKGLLEKYYVDCPQKEVRDVRDALAEAEIALDSI